MHIYIKQKYVSYFKIYTFEVIINCKSKIHFSHMLNKYFKAVIIVFSALFALKTEAQNKRKFKVHTIAFYNVENLFDTINDPNKYDEASPMMELKTARAEVYQKKSKIWLV